MKTTEIDGVTYAVAQPPTRWQDDYRAARITYALLLGLFFFTAIAQGLTKALVFSGPAIITYVILRTGSTFVLETKEGMRWKTTGHLWVEDGLLKFASPDIEWQLRRSDILGRREGRHSMIITLTPVGDRPPQEFRIYTQFKLADHASKIADEGESIRPPLFAPDYVREKTPRWIYGYALGWGCVLALMVTVAGWPERLADTSYLFLILAAFVFPFCPFVDVEKMRERELLAVHEFESGRQKLLQ